MQIVPILEYHNVDRAPEGARIPGLYVSPGRFRWQMRMLRLLGYRGVSMAEALPYLRGERAGRVFAITFDDAYQDVFEHALPVLAEHGFTATCYAVSARLGAYNVWDAAELGVRKPTMDLARLREWRGAGMEVGAHTRTHVRLPRCDDASLRREVRLGREELEQGVGAEVRQFCYPWGDFDDRTLAEVREAGFAAATTTRRGRARAGDDLLRLRRVPVKGQRPLAGFPFRVLTAYEDRRR